MREGRQIPESRFSLAPCAVSAVLCACSAAGQSAEAGPRVETQAPAPGAAQNTEGTMLVPTAPPGLASVGGSRASAGPEACATSRAEAERLSSPVDIVVTLDNSLSMVDEAGAVESNLNQSFAAILAGSGIDYRVILISEHRQSDSLLQRTRVCIEQPLSGLAQCPADEPSSGERFFHYSTEVGSNDSLDIVLETFAGERPDAFDLAPQGWSQWLRPDAKKVFLEFSDDDASTSAADFAAALTALAPEQFGSDPSQPAFVWHSVVGLAEKAVATEAYLPGEPIESAECAGNGNNVFNAGSTYQELSRLTGGLRFPICQFDAYDAVFSAIAASVVEVSRVACSLAIPTPPRGQALELDKVAVSYTPGDGSVPQVFGQVTDAAACQGQAFLVQGDSISLCPEACDRVGADSGAALDVLFTCESTLVLR